MTNMVEVPVRNDVLVDESFVLDEPTLLKGARLLENGLIIRPNFVPIEQVKIPWIVDAARCVYPITDTKGSPPGTIFHLNNGVWITNYHCVYFHIGATMEDKIGVSVISTYPPTALKGSEYFPKKWPGYTYYDPKTKGDVIAIKTKGGISVPELSTPLRVITPGEKVPSVMIGYPFGLPIEKGPYISYGGESQLFPNMHPLQGECSLRRMDGNSGSPIFDINGNLIGIFSGVFVSAKRIRQLVGRFKH